MSQVSPDKVKLAAGYGLERNGLEIDEIIPLNRTADALLQLESLKAAIENLQENQNLFLLAVKTKSPNTTASSSDPSKSGILNSPPLPGDLEKVYAGEKGELNTPYLLENAKVLLRAREFALAKNIFQTLIRSHQHSTDVFQGLAQCYESEGDYTKAEEAYQKAILYHSSGFAYQRLAQLQHQLGRFQSAAETLERYLAKLTLNSPDYLKACEEISELYLKAKIEKKAEEWIRKLLAVDGGNPRAQSLLARLLTERGQFESAMEVLNRLILQSPKDPQILTALGTLQFKTHQKKLALETLAKSLEIKLYQPEALSLLIRCAYELRSFATAARITEEYCEAAPVSVPLLYALAGLQFHLGRMDDLAQTGRQLLSIDPQHAGIKDLLKKAKKALPPISH